VHLYRKGSRKACYVHRLVLEAFAGPCPEGAEPRHLNGDRADNRWPQNLEWVTDQPSDQRPDDPQACPDGDGAEERRAAFLARLRGAQARHTDRAGSLAAGESNGEPTRSRNVSHDGAATCRRIDETPYAAWPAARQKVSADTCGHPGVLIPVLFRDIH
jgi:HNH endonuclease